MWTPLEALVKMQVLTKIIFQYYNFSVKSTRRTRNFRIAITKIDSFLTFSWIRNKLNRGKLYKYYFVISALKVMVVQNVLFRIREIWEHKNFFDFKQSEESTLYRKFLNQWDLEWKKIIPKTKKIDYNFKNCSKIYFKNIKQEKFIQLSERRSSKVLFLKTKTFVEL